MASKEPKDITLTDLLPTGFPVVEDTGPDIVAVPESVDERKILEGSDEEEPTWPERTSDDPEPPGPESVVLDRPEPEILPPLPVTTALTGKQMQAAYADAAGMKRHEIAKIAGVSVAQIAQWRMEPRYQQEVERLNDAATRDLELPMKAMHENLIIATNEAIETLKMGLNAVDDKNRPAWTTRLRAAEKLLDRGLDFTTAKTASGNTPGGGPAMNSSGAVVLVIKNE